MPRNLAIKKVLLIGSGPIVIGQAAEFDYAGTQALHALKEDQIEVVLVNSNPATIMTDLGMADEIYLEPLTEETLKRIIIKEKPDSILPNLGGQTGLTLAMKLAKSGFLAEQNVLLLGASPETIDKAEDRLIFKETMALIGQPVADSDVVTTVEDAVRFASTIGYPIIVRPAFTLGGSGGGIADNEEELRTISRKGLDESPITQILVERSIAGWKEIEFEVMRDADDNTFAICSMENFDPVGIHTGDSIVIAPAVTLADKEYQMLRDAALGIIRALGVEGGCNVQFALDPDSYAYNVIEVNPRVSRSSALASKATGYPIAKIAAKIAIGYRLDEIMNEVTGETTSAFEPVLDYVAVKFPKWPFDKMVYAKRELGTQMKATGEVLAIADTFEAALMKAVQGAEISMDTLNHEKFLSKNTDELEVILKGKATDERLFAVFAALKKGITPEQIHEWTQIDIWYLYKLVILKEYEVRLATEPLTEDLWFTGKQLGYSDRAIGRISCQAIPATDLTPCYKMVDTCGAEFAAKTAYFYSTWSRPEAGGENEVLPIIAAAAKERIVVLGAGPIRIGQGIEFDYSSVQAVHAFQKLGYEVVIINNNPETVSTDYDTADRLYFEPVTEESVMHIISIEKPYGVVVAYGGQTAIKLASFLDRSGVRILGTQADKIDEAEDRERFDRILEVLHIKRPMGETVFTTEQALAAAEELTYPVLMRPSYVLGGQNMIIAYNEDDIREYMTIILRTNPEKPILIDQYFEGLEIEVDAICDGEDILIPGIMQHVERTGIHSGDSFAIYPAPAIDDEMAAEVLETTRKLSIMIGALGMVNIQYIVKDKELYIIEMNPRASRTVPFLSKVTGVPMIWIATKVSMGGKLRDMEWGSGIYPKPPYVAVKAPVFSFEKLTDVDTQLGPEMKSTGEVLGIARTLEEAQYKAFVASGYKMARTGGVYISVRNQDKDEIVAIARKYHALDFAIYATRGTGEILKKSGMNVTFVDKISQPENGKYNSLSLLESGNVNYVISTSAKGRDPLRDSVIIRRRAVQLGIVCMTALDTADALVDSLASKYSEKTTELVEMNRRRTEKLTLRFTKMQTVGNDYIYFDCMDKIIPSPETISVTLSAKHFGVGADGIILILSSEKADAGLRMFNADGTEGAMCGNALRCVAKYLYDRKIVEKKVMTIETKRAIRTVQVFTTDGKVSSARVDMGKPDFLPAHVPVNLPGDRIIGQPVEIAGNTYTITCVSMGNPHCVVFVDETEQLNLLKIGPQIELFEKLFPERVNVEFVKVIDRTHIKMRVWERGSGETLACGTGACAAVAAAVENGLCDSDVPISVLLPGGKLIVEHTAEKVYLTGPAATVFEGTVEL